MKISANFEDKNRIREWAARGKSPEEISELVRVKADYVAAYLESLEPAKPKRKRKKVEQEKASEEEAPTDSEFDL